MKVIKAIMFANGAHCPHTGEYLKRADFESYGGAGFMTFTPDIRDAAKFPDASSALRFWQTQSKTVPLRPDGRPNRPLTALTIEIVDAP